MLSSVSSPKSFATFLKSFKAIYPVLMKMRTCFLWVKSDEDFVNLLSGLVGWWSGDHHLEKLVEFNQTTSVLVEFGNHLINCLGFGFNTEGVDSNFEFWNWIKKYLLDQWLLQDPDRRDRRLFWFKALLQSCSIRWQSRWDWMTWSLENIYKSSINLNLCSGSTEKYI